MGGLVIGLDWIGLEMGWEMKTRRKGWKGEGER